VSAKAPPHKANKNNNNLRIWTVRSDEVGIKKHNDDKDVDGVMRRGLIFTSENKKISLIVVLIEWGWRRLRSLEARC